MDDSILDGLPTDAFVEILLRLPPSARRRSRLVCRRWRDVVDARTPEGQSRRAKALVFFFNRSSHSPEPRCSAHVFDDLSPPSSSGREIWNSGTETAAELAIVGCCNGVIALWEEGTGRLTLVNPSTGETLAIPPPPRLPPKRRRRRAPPVVSCLSFGYHPITGKYKIVHLPADDAMAAASSSSCCSPFDVVEVFTRRWRNVAGGGGAARVELRRPPRRRQPRRRRVLGRRGQRRHVVRPGARACRGRRGAAPGDAARDMAGRPGRRRRKAGSRRDGMR